MRIGAERRWGRGRLVAVGSVLMAGVLAGCSGGPTTPVPQPAGNNAAAAAPGGGAGNAGPPVVPAARVAVRPANGARDVTPNTPITIQAERGKLSTVAVRNAAGKKVRGTMSADRTQWTSAEPLGYAKTYAVTATAVNSAGKPTRTGARFTTVTPVTYTMPYLFPSPDTETVGIGQPIRVHFDEAIEDKATAERSLTVTTSPATEGGWYWFDSQNVHWRPKNYWRPGTTVTVSANVYGVHVGRGIYGQQDVQSSFRIGASRIATIDDKTHLMTVRVNGQVVKRIPVSMGKGGGVRVNGRWIGFTTQSGPHVVQEKHKVKRMTSASYGLPKDSPEGYDQEIPLAVRISASGEFVHAASWSVADQGRRNVSHGCVNISPANARWFYDTFIPGDIVDIKNTGLDLSAGDLYGDWMVSWANWRKGSALR
jgi:lipoprotein-anchoring transpeptidase ErfK/SrfK